MKKYSSNELWAFVYRADSKEKIAIAEMWLKNHVTDNDLFDDLMIYLSRQYRELNAQILKDGTEFWF